MAEIKNILLVIIGFLSIATFAQTNPPPAPMPQNAVPPTVQAAPTAEPATSTAAPRPAGFYYYCERLRLYYPAVTNCPEGWIAIPVESPPPVQNQWNEWTSNDTDDIVKSQPNAVSLELFGRASTYSVDFDRAVSKHITLGLGFSSWSQSNWWHNYSATITVLPIYGNYYFTEYPQRGFLSVGVDFIRATQAGWNDDTFTQNGVAAVLGGGYEERNPHGFFYRLGGYIIAGHSFDVNPSLVLGFAF